MVITLLMRGCGSALRSQRLTGRSRYIDQHDALTIGLGGANRSLKLLKPCTTSTESVISRTEVHLILACKKLVDPCNHDVNGSLYDAVDFLLHSVHGLI